MNLRSPRAFVCIVVGSVIVFAVAVTILIMYVTVGFALRKTERDTQFRVLLAEADSHPSPPLTSWREGRLQASGEPIATPLSDPRLRVTGVTALTHVLEDR